MTADAGASAVPFPSDAEIREILVERIDVQKDGVGIVVGLIDENGRRIVAHGVRGKGNPQPVDGDTLFEIGSITKPFTALMLTDMAARGEVALDDPVARHLPPDVTMPRRGGRQITLRDLANHTSGLPRLPDNLFEGANHANPYAHYTVAQLYAFLSGHTLTRDIGATYEYSNLGAGLLGHVLERLAGTDFETMIRQRITGPLGMSATRIDMSRQPTPPLAIGHDRELKEVASWDLATLTGAGGIRSTASDMLTFLAAFLGFAETPLKAAMAAEIAPRTPTVIPDVQIALGWHVRTVDGREIITHSGGTGGYRAFAGFDVAARRGAVVLTNVSNVRGGDDIGMHLLTGAPLAPPPLVRTAITLPPGALQRYVGQYRMGPDQVFTLKLDGERLMAQLTGQAFFEIFPESERFFFWKVVDAQASFEIDAAGTVTMLTLHQNGRDWPYPRIAETPLTPPTP